MRKSQQLPFAIIACVLALGYLGYSAQRYFQAESVTPAESVVTTTDKAPSIQTQQQPIDLAIALHGIIIHSEAHLSKAIISIDGGEQISYLVGDELADNVIVQEITETNIVINNHNNLQLIDFV